jgi:hypothetical protein
VGQRWKKSYVLGTRIVLVMDVNWIELSWDCAPMAGFNINGIELLVT